LREGTDDAPYDEARIVVASFFAEHVLSLAGGLAHTVVRGGESVQALAEEQF